MHTYALSKSRVFGGAGVAVVSVAFAYITSEGIARLSLEQLWWIDIPSTMTYFALFLWLYDRWGWRATSWFGNILPGEFIGVPVLKGDWKGSLVTSHRSTDDRKPITAHIQQTWSKIEICVETESSRSRSFSASFKIAGLPSVWYLYRNEPTPPKKDRRMDAHRGVGCIRFRQKTNEPISIEIEYFTDRQVATSGTIKLERKTS